MTESPSNDEPTAPSLNGGNGGRGRSGRFLPGNPGGPGNPHTKHVNELRTALYRAVTPEQVAKVAETLLAKAIAGELPAIRELLERLFGPPQPMDVLERLAELEALLDPSKRGGP